MATILVSEGKFPSNRHFRCDTNWNSCAIPCTRNLFDLLCARDLFDAVRRTLAVKGGRSGAPPNACFRKAPRSGVDPFLTLPRSGNTEPWVQHYLVNRPDALPSLLLVRFLPYIVHGLLDGKISPFAIEPLPVRLCSIAAAAILQPLLSKHKLRRRKWKFFVKPLNVHCGRGEGVHGSARSQVLAT